MQKAFDAMKALMAANTLLAYPDLNKPFRIETDTSDFQMGAVIKQDGKIVASIVIDPHYAPRTVALFTEARQALMSQLLTDDAYSNYQRYIRTVRKPRQMTPLQVASRLHVLNLFSVHFRLTLPPRSRTKPPWSRSSST